MPKKLHHEVGTFDLTEIHNKEICDLKKLKYIMYVTKQKQ